MNYLEYSNRIPLDQLAQNLDSALDSLGSPRMRDILESIYIDGQTLRQVAERYHVTVSRIQSVRLTALRRMRHPERLRILIGEDPFRPLELRQGDVRATLEHLRATGSLKGPTLLTPQQRQLVIAQLKAESIAITKKSHDAHVRYQANAQQREKQHRRLLREQRRRDREDQLRWEAIASGKIKVTDADFSNGAPDPVPENSFRDQQGQPLFTAWWRLK